jgi:hypothetical protein
VVGVNIVPEFSVLVASENGPGIPEKGVTILNDENKNRARIVKQIRVRRRIHINLEDAV